jgi:hypothetical protein
MILRSSISLQRGEKRREKGHFTLRRNANTTVLRINILQRETTSRRMKANGNK